MITAQKFRLPSKVMTEPRVGALMLSQLFALIWWTAALWLRDVGVNVWHDQVYMFRPAALTLFDPYRLPGFVHTPWATLLIAPFAVLPLEISMLLQTCLYFALLTLVIFRFGGGRLAVVVSLTSFVALDAVLEMNIDWLVLIGLLLPVTYSAPFLLLKPQLALGYYFGVPPRRWLKIGLVAGIILLPSFVFWGFWPAVILERVGAYSVGRFFNLAPLNLLPFPVSLAIGAALAYLSLRRQDPPLGILAWVFFTPYITLYSLLLAFAILAIRLRRAAVIISLSMWGVYGAVFIAAALR